MRHGPIHIRECDDLDSVALIILAHVISKMADVFGDLLG